MQYRCASRETDPSTRHSSSCRSIPKASADNRLPHKKRYPLHPELYERIAGDGPEPDFINTLVVRGTSPERTSR